MLDIFCLPFQIYLSPPWSRPLGADLHGLISETPCSDFQLSLANRKHQNET